jgi:hypothetical protein
VARVGADHAHNTFAADDLAIAADGFDRSRNSHLISPETLWAELPAPKHNVRQAQAFGVNSTFQIF